MKDEHDDKRDPLADYSYSSTELSRFYGLTIKGMEFYENKGIVQPERVGQGKIRRFNLADSYRLYAARLLRNSGMGLEETAGILESSSLAHIRTRIDNRVSNMKQGLLIKQRMLVHLEHMSHMLRLAEAQEPFFETITLGGFYQLFLRRFSGPHQSNREQTSEYRLWNEYLPITAASLRFLHADCLAEHGTIDTRIGLIMEEQDFLDFNFRESDRTQYIPGGRFLHTFIRGNALALHHRAWLEPALAYLRTHQLRLSGDAFTRMFFVGDDNGVETRYDELWMPINGEP